MNIDSKKGPALIFMAAGIGSRYGGLKQMDPLGPDGEVIIDYSAYDAMRAGFSRIVIIIRKDMEALFRERIGNRIARHIEVVYAFQEIDDLPAGFSVPAGRTKPWGTTQAILSAARLIDGPFGVINSDDFYGLGAFEVLCSALRTMQNQGAVTSCCNVSYAVENTLSEHGYVTRGICALDAQGFLSEIVERKKVQQFPDGIKYETGDGLWAMVAPDAVSSMNMWGFTAEIMPVLKNRFESFLARSGQEMTSECLIPVVAGELVKEHKATVKVLRTGEKWFGVTYKEDKPMVQKAIMDLIGAGKYPERLWG